MAAFTRGRSRSGPPTDRAYHRQRPDRRYCECLRLLYACRDFQGDRSSLVARVLGGIPDVGAASSSDRVSSLTGACTYDSALPVPARCVSTGPHCRDYRDTHVHFDRYGPMHLASSTAVPTIGLFHASDPALYRPLKPNDLAIDIIHCSRVPSRIAVNPFGESPILSLLA